MVGICPDVVQDVPDFGAVRNERDDAHLPPHSGTSGKTPRRCAQSTAHRSALAVWGSTGSVWMVVLDAVAPAMAMLRGAVSSPRGGWIG